MSLFSDVFSLPVHFEFFAFCQVFLPVKENAEIETGMAETSIRDQADIRQKIGLVWRIERKFAKLSKTTFTYCSSCYFMDLSIKRRLGLRGVQPSMSKCPH
jgi:hypothetical protein